MATRNTSLGYKLKSILNKGEKEIHTVDRCRQKSVLGSNSDVNYAGRTIDSVRMLTTTSFFNSLLCNYCKFTVTLYNTKRGGWHKTRLLPLKEKDKNTNRFANNSYLGISKLVILNILCFFKYWFVSDRNMILYETVTVKGASLLTPDLGFLISALWQSKVQQCGQTY